MKLDANVLRNFKIAKSYESKSITGITKPTNCLNFSSDGENLICSFKESDYISVFDCQSSYLSNKIKCGKYGVGSVIYARDNNTALHSSTKYNDSIQYLSISEKKYIHYFTGHTKEVLSLHLSPKNDSLFLSNSLDNTIRLWDLRSPSYQNCVGIMHIPESYESSVASFDPEGLLFAVGLNSEAIKLYDLRTFDSGPFSSFALDTKNKTNKCKWAELKFSPDSSSILVSTNNSVIWLLNAFSGKIEHILTGHKNNTDVPIKTTFSPDSLLVFSNSTDGCIYVWSTNTGLQVCTLDTLSQPGPVLHVEFNPKYMMLASACTNVAFWIPCCEGL